MILAVMALILVGCGDGGTCDVLGRNTTNSTATETYQCGEVVYSWRCLWPNRQCLCVTQACKKCKPDVSSFYLASNMDGQDIDTIRQEVFKQAACTIPPPM